MRIAAATSSASLLSGLLRGGRRRRASPAALDEIVVTAERAGPGMWHVHRGDANVWILGSISPLPRDITWRSKQVESVLESTSQVLVQKPIEISIPRILWMLIADRKLLMVGGGKRLKDVLPPDLHARFAAQRSKVERRCGQVGTISPDHCGGISAAGRLSSSQPVDAARSAARRCESWPKSMACASRRSRLRA